MNIRQYLLRLILLEILIVLLIGSLGLYRIFHQNNTENKVLSYASSQTKNDSVLQMAEKILGCVSYRDCTLLCQRQENKQKCKDFARKYGVSQKDTPLRNEGLMSSPRVIGYVGCSNSANAANGYNNTQGKKLLWQAYATGGASIDFWADFSSSYWNAFDQQISVYRQPQKVWVQLCENVPHKLVNYNDVLSLFTNLKKHAPSAVFYISPINSYTIDNCRLLGSNGEGITDSRVWTQRAVKENIAKKGPELGPLSSFELSSDNCHPNQQGEFLLGKQLHNFFDNLTN